MLVPVLVLLLTLIYCVRYRMIYRGFRVSTTKPRTYYVNYRQYFECCQVLGNTMQTRFGGLDVVVDG